MEHGTAIATVRRYNRIRTPYFQELLKLARQQAMKPKRHRPLRLVEFVGRGSPFQH
jgi:hypothetical protein